MGEDNILARRGGLHNPNIVISGSVHFLLQGLGRCSFIP